MGCIFYAWNVTPRKQGGKKGGYKVQVEQLMLEYTCINPRLSALFPSWLCRLHAYLLNRHDMIITGIWTKTFALGQKQMNITERVAKCTLVAVAPFFFSSCDAFSCSLLTPTAFLPSVSLCFYFEASNLVRLRSHEQLDTE